MDDYFSRSFEQLLARSAGTFNFRFILQPIAASIIAIRAGIRDAKENRPPYLWTLLFERGSRRSLMRSAWSDTANVFVIAVMLDVVYQLIEFHWIYPLQAIIIAVALAIVPYVFLRGPVSRITKIVRGPEENRR